MKSRRDYHSSTLEDIQYIQAYYAEIERVTKIEQEQAEEQRQKLL
jgi:hypothetical protein